MAGTRLVLEGLVKRYGDGPAAVDGIALDVAPGELLGLLGPSGCGKTTTLRMIGGLIPATAGRIMVGGRDVTALPTHKRDMGIVFQSYALFPHMDVAGNVAFGLEMRGMKRAEIAARVHAALDLVRLGPLAGRRPRALSGGQQQRVALARALVIEPAILLLDEPLSNLDAKLRDEMRAEITDIQRRLGITTVFVTHDQAEALAMCDRIAVMEQGRIAQLGTPYDIYEHPACEFVADFVGRSNRIPAQAGPDGIALGGHILKTPSPTAPGPVTVMIRPHRIELAPPAGPDWNSVSGTVTRVTYVGDLLAVDLDVAGAPVHAERPTRPGMQPPAIGCQTPVSWRISDTMAFPRVR